MQISKAWVRVAVVALLVAQAVQVVITLHRESLTWDESAHLYAGYRMWKNGDFGINPEHPPLVKLLATLPVLHEKLWVPPLKGIFFKAEEYLSGRDWLEHNDGGGQRLVFRMRLATAILALALSLVVFFAAHEWFGEIAALVALTLTVFDPNLLAHSGLVTTDLGTALFFLAAIYSYYRYVKRPALSRLLIAAVMTGLLLATKHSGILIVPTLLLLIGWELAATPKGERLYLARRLAKAFVVIAVVGMGILWAFYGFRYAARPAGLALIPTLSDYSQDLPRFQRATIWWIARLHLLPESYIFGLVDVRLFARVFTTYILGRWYPHGVWWYFPAVLMMKTTLGFLILLAISGFAIVTGRLGKWRESDRVRPLAYLILSGGLFLAVAIVNGLNIGVRHILPLYPIAAILAGAGAAALVTRSRAWMWVCIALLAAHVASALSVFPNSIAYANEAWGGSWNAYRILNDSNVDWGRQLYQVKEWEDRHPGEDCWFAYTVSPFIRPETYNIHCHVLPNGMGGAGTELVPPVIHGTVLLSVAEVQGGLWPSQETNPYRAFKTRRPDEEIDYGVLVYRGDIHVEEAGGMSLANLSVEKLRAGQPQEALQLAEQAVKLQPGGLYAEWALGDAAAAVGKKDEARAAYNATIEATKKLDPQRQAEYTKYLEESLKKL